MTCVVGGVGASAAYKKWERAAIAGVSLVADAAEELERKMMTQNLSNVDATMRPNNLSTVDGIISSVCVVVHLLTGLLFLVFVL